MRIPLHYKISFLSALLLVTVSWLVMRCVYKESTDVLFEHEETDLREEGLLKCKRIETAINQLRSDTFAISSSRDVRNLLELIHESQASTSQDDDSPDVDSEATVDSEDATDADNKMEELLERVGELFLNLCVNDEMEPPVAAGASQASRVVFLDKLQPYDQIRLINAKGREICRLEMDRMIIPRGNSIDPQTPELRLDEFFQFEKYVLNNIVQDKSAQDYFLAALQVKKCVANGSMQLEPPRVYLSQIDLNTEKDENNQDKKDPERPVIRAWVPMFGEQGDAREAPFLGMVIVNMDFAPLRREIASSPRHLTYLSNDDGELLIHPNPRHQFAWDRNEKQEYLDELKQDGVPYRSFATEVQDGLEGWGQRTRTPTELEKSERKSERKSAGTPTDNQDANQQNQNTTVAGTFDDTFKDLQVVNDGGKKLGQLAYRGWQISDLDNNSFEPPEQLMLFRYPNKDEISLTDWKWFKHYLNRELGSEKVRFQKTDLIDKFVLFSVLIDRHDDPQELESRIEKIPSKYSLGFELPESEYSVVCQEFAAYYFRVYLNPQTDAIPNIDELRKSGSGDIENPYDKHVSLLVAFSKQEMNAELRNTESKVWWYVKALAGIGCLAALFSSILLTRRLRFLKTAADDMAAGDFTKEIPEARGPAAIVTDEVSDLVSSFRSMKDGIVEREKKIKGMNAELEDKVARRTAELEKTLGALKKERDKAEQLNTAKDGFLASVSHELRNPLNQVTGFCQLLELSPLDDGQLDDVNKIRTAAKRQLGLVNDILDYQKIIMNGVNLEPENLKVGEILHGVFDSQRFRAEQHGNDLLIECDEGDETVYADPKRLMQVLENLVGNALKFTLEGTVVLSAKRHSDSFNSWWVFKVKDNGRGMHPEEIAQLFQPFKKLAASEGNQEGTGLGLVIARGLCVAMNGDISCHSTFGEGSSFVVRMPQTTNDTVEETDSSSGDITTLPPPGKTGIMKRPMDAASGQPDSVVIKMFAEKAATAKVDPHDYSILVIDDEADSRELISRYLGKMEFEVIVATDGVDGLKKAKNRRPALITLDARMPDIDGWAILAALKSDPETSRIPVVMVTVSDQTLRAEALGADAFVPKPIDWDKFSEVIMQQISGSCEKQVLIVDDDPQAREIIRRLLTQAGWKVVEANNGQEALEVLETTIPSAIVLDLIMPVMDGFEFLKRYSENPGLRSVPVIVQTSKETSGKEQQLISGVVVKVMKKGDASTSDLLLELQKVTQ